MASTTPRLGLTKPDIGDTAWGVTLNTDMDITDAGVALVGHAHSGTYVTVGTEFYNVKDYGALGDGTTDDTTAINLALTAASGAGGGLVFFPKGTYRISSTLTLLEQVSIRGAGRNVTTIKATSGFPTSSALINLGDPVSTSTSDLVFHTRIEDMTLRCNNIAGSIGVYTNKANEQSGCYRVEISEYLTYGFRAEVNVVKPDNFAIEQCEFYPSSSATVSIGIYVSNVVSKVVVRDTTINMSFTTPVQTAGIWLENCEGYYLDAIHVEYHADGVLISNTSSGRSGVISFVDNRHGTNVVNTNAVVVVIGASSTGSTTTTINDTLRSVTATGYVPFYCASMPGTLWATPATTGLAVLRSLVTGEGNNRFRLGADGELQWGPGSSATDVVLRRSTTSTLALNDGNNLAVGSTTGTKIGTATTQKIGFYNSSPIVKPTVTGARNQDAAGASLLTQLAALGLVVDSTTAGFFGGQPAFKAANYYWTVPTSSTATSNTLTFGTLRVHPFFVPTDMTITSIGAEISSAGGAATVMRLGIFNDTGSAYPGTVLLDAGTISGTSATVQEIVVSQALTAGLYWIGGVTQDPGSTGTQPTVRIAGTFMINGGQTTIPTANQGGMGGYLQTSVTGALSTFTASVTGTSTALRMFVKVGSIP